MKNNKRQIRKNKKTERDGFTLIELILYVSISSVLLFGASMAFQVLFVSQVKSQAIQEVEAQGAAAVARITQAMRNADSITLPVKGTPTSTLSLVFLAAGSNPTIVDIATGTLRIREGAATTSTALTNSKITASALLFSNLSRTSTPGIVRVQFTLQYINPANKNEYNYSQTFFGSGALE